MIDAHITNALVKIVELKDHTTVAHTWRVALYAQALAEAVGMERDEVHRIMQGAVLHDIGKLDIPDDILGKPAGLTEAEKELLRSHTIKGYERLQRMGVTDPLILSLVRSHHERWDGSGYPDGLRELEIPAAARSFAVIDTFDAMTSLRPYRRETGPEAAARAVEELQQLAGTRYCPQSVRAFVDLYHSGVIDWILSHFNDEDSLSELAPGPDPETIIRARQALMEREETHRRA